MSFGTIVTLTGSLHTWTYIPEGVDPWQAFAGASEGGGTPPEWTQDDDPKTAVPPTDAAGTLWREGETEAVPETIREVANEFSTRILNGLECRAAAAYFSSGGRGVFLLQSGPCHYVIVARGGRPIGVPRIGASEEAMCNRTDMRLNEVVLFD
jgi:hypothetical protein